MTQLFRNDEACEFFYNITLTAKQRVIINELVQMNSEMVGSNHLVTCFTITTHFRCLPDLTAISLPKTTWPFCRQCKRLALTIHIHWSLSKS